MEEMRELITIEAFDRAILVVCVIWTAACALVGFAARLRRRREKVLLAVAWGSLGPLALAMRRFYSWMMRVEPETGYVGLHKVSAFAISLVAFIMVGAAVGIMFGKLYRRTRADAD